MIFQCCFCYSCCIWPWPFAFSGFWRWFRHCTSSKPYLWERLSPGTRTRVFRSWQWQQDHRPWKVLRWVTWVSKPNFGTVMENLEMLRNCRFFIKSQNNQNLHRNLWIYISKNGSVIFLLLENNFIWWLLLNLEDLKHALVCCIAGIC